MFHQIKKKGWLYRIWYYFERRGKETAFDCHMCGQCVLRSVALECPMQCPKQLRNGPCGGSMDGKCEVFPDKACVWTKIHERTDHFQWTHEKIKGIQPAVDWSLFGTSATLNIFEKKIDTSGHAFSPAPLPCGNRFSPGEDTPEIDETPAQPEASPAKKD